MDLTFSTAELAPADRLDAWRDLVSRVFLPLAISSHDSAGTSVPDGSRGFEGSVSGSQLGGIRIWRVRATSMSAVRTRRHIQTADAGEYLLALHVTGTAHASQDGRDVILGPGDFALLDSSRPYSISFFADGFFEHVIYQVPRDSLGGYGGIAATTARVVPAASGIGELVAPYLLTLARSPGAGNDGSAVSGFVDAGLDLAVRALRTVAGLEYHSQPAGRGLSGELKRYALDHLGDPRLSPDAVAAASFVSVRQLHRHFALDGVSFGAWVRVERLRRCRDDLTNSQLSHLAIAEIASRWGFRSAAHFSRVFTARYGLTPSQLRRAARGARES